MGTLGGFPHRGDTAGAHPQEQAHGAVEGEHVTALFTDPTFVDPLITTLIIAFSVSAICCAVAAPLGWLVAR